jgi:nucleoside-diphosphate-sugar epimerase
MVKVVITGASGNVGTGLVRALAADDSEHEVVGVCLRPPGTVAPYGSMTWQSCDLASGTAPDVLDDVMRGADAVVHLAWMFQPVRDGTRLHRTNFKGTTSPLIDTTRAHEELGWMPRKSSADCVREQIGGIADATALPSPALRRDRFSTEPRVP